MPELRGRAGRRHRLPEGASRLAQFPGLREASRFVAELRGRTRISAVRAVVDGLVVATMLKRRGVRALVPTPSTSLLSSDPDRSVEVAHAVDAGLGMLPLAPTCLRRSITLVRELSRLGLAASMHIGVKTVADTVEAHAWVQAGDVVLNDDPVVTKSYVELAAGDLERVLHLLP